MKPHFALENFQNTFRLRDGGGAKKFTIKLPIN